MIVFPNCKINLGLHVTEKRGDGYHNIETVFYPLPFTDALEIMSAHQPNQQNVSFTSTGFSIPGNNEDNICVKAYQLLKKDFPALPAVQMHLHKAIPMGAGLGGGSADGAFILQLLNKKYNLQLSTSQLMHYALQLGSDVPFFILNKPVFASGRGELMEEIKIDLRGFYILIVNPGIHINTAWAYAAVQPRQPQKNIIEIVQQPVHEWKNILKNDFEEGVIESQPALQQIKDKLYAHGALYASMSGSGSSFYGIFPDEYLLQKISWPAHYRIKYRKL